MSDRAADVTPPDLTQPQRLDLEEGKRLLSEATPGPPWSQDAYYIVGDVRGGRPNGEVIAGFRPSVAHLGMRPHPTKPGYFVEDRDVLNNRANTALAVWAVNNAESLIAAAEDAEKLRGENAELDARNDVAEGDWNIIADSLLRRGVQWRMDQRVAIVHGLIREAMRLRRLTPEALAQQFHETYERLAPQFSYKTREVSAVPWADVPENNRRLMIAVCSELLAALTPPEPLSAPQETA